jgi:hypothetical protein
METQPRVFEDDLKSKPERKHPARMPVAERHNEPVIIFLTVCSKDRKHIFASPDSAAVIINAWRNAKSWLVGRYVIMPIIFISFAHPAYSLPNRSNNGCAIGKTSRLAIGRARTSNQFGNAIFGTRNYAGMKIMTRSGTTCSIIPFVHNSSRNHAIGDFKVS